MDAFLFVTLLRIGGRVLLAGLVTDGNALLEAAYTKENDGYI